VAKINLSRMDVQALIDLRHRVEEALVSQRAKLERQLEALGSSIASLGGKNGARRARERNEGKEGCAEISQSRWRDMGRTRRNAEMVERGG
jgi:hypothetical protein